MLKHPYFLIIAGPTGVGKSDFAEHLARALSAEIVNADMGQCYTPLSIGTAKPDWQASDIPHHGFDTLDEPRDLTVAQYRDCLKIILENIWRRGKLPIVVGGSSFYLASLFFPPKAEVDAVPVTHEPPGEDLWQQLSFIDPERARHIDPHDHFRIKRALEIWRITGIKPSEYVPTYDPLAPYHMIFLTRDTEELSMRIAKRVRQMLQAGWIDEVKALKGTPWEPFLLRKKIIGYDDILRFLEVADPGPEEHEMLEEFIAQRTRQYAKRQRTFWRMLEKKLKEHKYPVETIIMSERNMQEYAEQLIKKLRALMV
ncbi:MAG: tRNA (adenosine(37)-N6)-dimethylallyltransferase MiaA [Candidatus Babeliales bacterium]